MSCWSQGPDGGLLLSVRATPNAARDMIEGPWRDSSGQSWLSIRVRQPPDAGRANTAVVELLAQQLAVRKRDIRLVSGATARLKRFHLDGDSKALAAQIEALMGDSE